MCREFSSWYVVFFYPKIVEYYKKLFKIICYLLQKYIFFTKNLSICIFCSTFAANIPFSEYGLGCPRLEGLSVLAVLFFLMRYQFYPNLFHIFAVNIIFRIYILGLFKSTTSTTCFNNLRGNQLPAALKESHVSVNMLFCIAVSSRI